MKQWNYLQACLDPNDQDKASGFLWDLGTQGIEEQPLTSGRVRIKAYFDSATDLRSLQERFVIRCQNAGIRLFSFLARIKSERDWFRKWHQDLRPFSVGRSYYVIPCKNFADPIPKQRIPILLEPGMAFGTGTHETTQLCLEAMEDYLQPGARVLDVGTGSGVLAIAAAKLGARQVVACDIDPIAIQIARGNTSINQSSSQIELIVGDVTKVGRARFDILVANLTLEIIEDSISQFETRVKNGGWLILSGVLRPQSKQVRALLNKGSLRIQASKAKGEWTSFVLERNIR